MAGEEKKRTPAMEASISQPPAKKMRVELSQLPDAVNPQIGAAESNPKDTKSEKHEQEVEPEKSKEIDVSSVGVVIPDGDQDELKVEHPRMSSRYASKLYQYLRSKEVEPKRRPLSNYMEVVQWDVTANMRGIIIDWLVEIAEEYDLQSDTLFLTVSYFDRYLSYHAISRQKLQLLVLSSMLIAWKYDEVTPPHVEYFCDMTANGYSKEEVLDMEGDLLKFLKSETGPPTIMTFLRRFIDAAQEDSKRSYSKMRFMAHYLAELSLIDYGFVKFLPSVVAASAIYLARFTAVPTMLTWNKKLEESTGYKAIDLKECIYALHKLQLSNSCSSLRAVRNKYQDRHLMFMSASTLLPPFEVLQFCFCDEQKN